MKRTILVLILFFLCLIGFFTVLRSKNTLVSVSLIINNKAINSNAQICDNHAELPFLEVLNALGCTVNRIDDRLTQIIYNNKIYILDFPGLTLRSEDSSINILTPAPGSRFYICKQSNDDILVDHVTLKGVLHLMGIVVDIDWDKRMVCVKERVEQG